MKTALGTIGGTRGGVPESGNGVRRTMLFGRSWCGTAIGNHMPPEEPPIADVLHTVRGRSDQWQELCSVLDEHLATEPGRMPHHLHVAPRVARQAPSSAGQAANG